MEKAMTLKEIATLAGVSLTTASRVVNDLPGVKPATRDRVLEIIRRYGYQPDPAARFLASQRVRKNN